MSALTILGVLRVETEASIWIIEPDRYLRLPKVEGPRRDLAASLDEALTDAQWMPHRGVYEHHNPFSSERRLRIFPAWRPDDSAGIVTGVIVTITPPLPSAVDSTPAEPAASDSQQPGGHRATGDAGESDR